ncbi:amidohydrolase family protein [Stakelama sp. CBK3Z-3]|uniref:Amidohydrolase family protein n=1 Tax=Stakelama flava TaxID=2860338 RepID=A0ABS6XN16_9SPHN|nr:amidohydrolase family protein [Stakelama flava]MBW4331608.1 amidohydrolase family protein [Stakelama flava]
MRIFDAHQHFWTIGGPGQSWPDADWPEIHRDFGPDDLRDATQGLDLAGTILVQSQADDRDTDWMCETVGRDSLVRGLVVWANLASEDAPERIALLAAREKVVGIRPMLQAIDDSDWIDSEALHPAIATMVAHGLRFDALVQPRHLRALQRFASAWPALPIVIDHGAKPPAASGQLEPWRSDLAALAALPNVWCKLSGLRTEQAPGQDPAALASYVDQILTLFGERVMWGSDWPVLLHAGDAYRDWVRDAYALARNNQRFDEQRLFLDAAREFYGLDR